MIKFEEDCTMKPKIYPFDCAVGGNNSQPIIVITYNECTFSAKDGIQRPWTRVGNNFLQPKSCGQGIMTLEFVFPFVRLNLASLNPEKKTKQWKSVD